MTSAEDMDLSLIENRSIAYEACFIGELPYNPTPDETDIGLSGLWRVYTNKNGSHGDDLNEHLGMIEATVKGILRNHDNNARDQDGSREAIFGLIDPETYLETLTNITSQTLKLWEKALWRNNHGSVIASNGTQEEMQIKTKAEDLERQQERLAHLLSRESVVIETATAVIQVLPTFAKNGLQPTRQEQTNIAKVLASWGPQFLTEWLDGSILSHWMNRQDIPTNEQDEWRETFTPSILKRLTVYNISDPLKALERVKANIKLLSDEALLAERLGWSEADVRETFTPGILKYLAVHNISDPLKALERVKANIKLLSDEALLAERLGWSEADVRETFTPGILKHLAAGNISNPLTGVENYINGKIQYSSKYYVPSK